MVENKAAASIFMLVRHQTEMRWNGEQDMEIDLRHEALWKAVEKYPGGVKDEWGTFLKIVRAWHLVKRNQRAER